MRGRIRGVWGAGWDDKEVGDQSGRVALVTGSNSGIGYEAARGLLARGARVLLACRSPERAAAALDRLSAEVPDADVAVVQLDLADLASVRAAADQVLAAESRLDLLVNNAGIMAVPQGRTADGFELHIGTNHLGPFALTARLWPLLGSTSGSRVVAVSSQAHRGARLPERDVDVLMGATGYRRWQQYARSKLANLLFAYELDRRRRAAGMSPMSIACHPGGVGTDLARDTGNALRALEPLMRIAMQSPRQGAWPVLRAACDPDAEGGQCFAPRGPAELRGRPVLVTTSALSRNTDLAGWLWEISEELTGCRWPW